VDADARVEAHAPGHQLDVGSGPLAHPGHRVDEADLGGQEGVGGVLDQLGGGPVGGQEGRTGALKDRVVELAQGGQAPLGAGADDHAVRVEGVGHGRPLAQELGVGGDLPVGLGPGLAGDHLGDPLAGLHRHRRLLADQPELARGQAAGHLPGHRLDEGQVGAAVAPARGADADEDHRPVPDRLGLVAGHPEPPLPDHLAEQLLETRLVEPGAALADEVQLAGVVVVDHDVVADMGKGGSGDEANVAGADHGDAHAGRLLGPVE
jgi:hypothetical protein